MWQQWRSRTDLAGPTCRATVLLPLFGDDLAAWSNDDPQRRILAGIAKHAWSRNQAALRELTAAYAALHAAGIDALLTGAAASAMLLSNRTLPFWAPTLLVRRTQAGPALECLRAAGWRNIDSPAAEQTLETVALNRPPAAAISLSCSLIPCPPHVAPRLDADVWNSPHLVAWGGRNLPVPSPAVHLTEVLIRPGEFDILRLCEALLLLRQQPPDWRKLHAVASLSDSPKTVAMRLAYLRRWNQRVPWRFAAQSRLWSLGLYRRAMALVRDYRNWIWQTGQPRSGTTFARYLERRWGAHRLIELPFLGMRRLGRSGAGPE
jgi:hypothetical protein